MATTRKTPETLTAVSRAATLARTSAALPPLSIAPRPPAQTPYTRTEARNAAAVEQARANLGQIGKPTHPTPQRPSLDPRSDADDSFSILSIGDIEPYEHNPRTGANPRYEDIRASIVADGITNPITVTRRPQAAKYHPYGGGNTRLAIAKELQANGDPRFNTLRVVVKSWPGDANVISAHLAENENRGDISFWEKARGVAAFKRAHEQEHDVVLSTAELSRELKSHGISFGLRVIQNFAFAAEHLSQVGPWLKATEVNEVIRPGMAGAMLVATCFGLRDQTALFASVLFKHHDQVLATITRNKELEPAQRKLVELDAAELVADLHEAVALATGVSPEAMPLLVSAVESNRRITAEELKAIQIRKPAERASAASPALVPEPSLPLGPQRSLGGMLAGIPAASATSSATVQAPTPDRAPTATPSAINPSDPATAALMPAFGRTASHHRNPSLPENVGEDDPTARVLSLVLDLSDLAVLQDCILHVKDMPFGYFMDMPKALNKVGEQTLPEGQIEVRAATWKLLASLSGQIDPKWFTHVNDQTSNWVRFAKAGPDVFDQNYGQLLRGVTDGGNPTMLLGEVYLMFSLPELGLLTVQLLRAMEQLRLDHPERFMKSVVPDPDLPA
jgi:ParB family protein of integrating conjugative element (PFGI_1 class)